MKLAELDRTEWRKLEDREVSLLTMIFEDDEKYHYFNVMVRKGMSLQDVTTLFGDVRIRLADGTPDATTPKR